MGIRLYVSATLLLLLISCNRKQEHKAIPGNKSKRVARIESVDSEKVIDNEYTRIVLSLCDHIEFKELQYTTGNTTIIGLDIHQPTSCFLFASEISCGFPAGSCGDDIQVIRKDSSGYRQIFSVCGYVYNSLSETNEGIKSFIYGTGDGYKIKVSWNGRKFEETILSINNLNYACIREITRITGIMESDFIPEDPTNDDRMHIRVRTEAVDIGNDRTATLYTVMQQQGASYFLFDVVNGSGKARLLLHTAKISSLQPVPNPLKEYPDIITTSDFKSTGNPKDHFTTQLWRYDKSLKIYKPTKK